MTREEELRTALDFNREAHRILNNAGVPTEIGTSPALFLWQRVEWLVADRDRLAALASSPTSEQAELAFGRG